MVYMWNCPVQEPLGYHLSLPFYFYFFSFFERTYIFYVAIGLFKLTCLKQHDLTNGTVVIVLLVCKLFGHVCACSCAFNKIGRTLWISFSYG